MGFLDNINGVSEQRIKNLAETAKEALSDEFKGVIDFCIGDAEDYTDSYGGNGYEGNGYEGNGFDGNGFADFGGNGFDDFGTNGYEGNGYDGNGFADFGGNGEAYLNDYSFDDINDLWQEG